MNTFNHSPILMAYVAGPYSAPTWEETEANIRKAEEVGLWLTKHNIYPIIPHANTSRREFSDLQEYSFWLMATAELMVRAADVVVLTRRWKESSGARGELELAQQLGMHFVRMQDGEQRALQELQRVVPRSEIRLRVAALAMPELGAIA